MKKETSILSKRVYAFTTDLAIIVITNYFLMAAFTRFVQTIFFHFPIRTQLFLIQKMQMMTSVSLLSLTFAYFSLFYFLTNGHTMGKTLFGIKVQSPTGEITLKQSILRSLAYFTCAITGSFLFALSYIRKDQKSLADVFSGTTVALDDEKEVKGTEFEMTLHTTLLMIRDDEMNTENSTKNDEEDKAA
jgi:uncharacterized RDD family membrane protein YckC